MVLQVALMSAVPSAMAALDGHRGVAAVAEYGLGFLLNQSLAAENRVRLGVPKSVTRPGDRVCRASGRVKHVCVHMHISGVGTVGGGLLWAKANVRAREGCDD